MITLLQINAFVWLTALMLKSLPSPKPRTLTAAELRRTVLK